MPDSSTHCAQDLILMYHRVVDLELDPWQLCVSPKEFERQIDCLSSFAEPVQLADIPDRGSASGKPRVAVTFDDGYADILFSALPILERHSIPATVFIVGNAITSGSEFWWDQLEQILLLPSQLPNVLYISTPKGPFKRELNLARNYTTDQKYLDRDFEVFNAPVGSRLHLFREVWELLSFMTHRQQEDALSQLRAWAGHIPEAARSTHRILTETELDKLASHPLIDIGAHTMHHCRLPALSAETQKTEIINSISFLENRLSRKITAFSYPFGQYNKHSVRILSETRIQQAVTTKPGNISRQHPMLELSRFTMTKGMDCYPWQ